MLCFETVKKQTQFKANRRLLVGSLKQAERVWNGSPKACFTDNDLKKQSQFAG